MSSWLLTQLSCNMVVANFLEGTFGHTRDMLLINLHFKRTQNNVLACH